MGLSLAVRSPAYSASALDVTRVYVGTEVTAEVGVGNNTRVPVRLGRAEGRWVDALSLTMECLSCPDGDPADIVSRFTAQARLEDGVPADGEVRPGGVAYARLALPSTAGLKPGRYRLTVSLPPQALDALARRLRNALVREVIFELKSPETVAETADAYLQMAYVFTQQGRHGEARQWAERVLTIKPESLAAQVEIGASWMRENNCSMATPLLERAIRRIEAGDDPELRMSATGREDWAAGLRGILRTRCAR